MNIVLVGLSHKTAPVEVRECLAFQESKLPKAFKALKGEPLFKEAALISTCNRVELYVVSDDATSAISRLKEFLVSFHNINYPISDKLYAYTQPESVQHLFRVASGLESMVLGETEVLGQVKKAYYSAHSLGATGKVLNILFHKALNIGKKVRAETGIGEGAMSVSSAAVDLAGEIFSDLAARKVMIIGAGKMSELTAKSLIKQGVSSVIVSNRSYERAVELAKTFNGAPLRLDEALSRMVDIDILISSTGAPHFIIKEKDIRDLMHARRNRPIFLIDIAVPRDIEPSVNKIDNVYLYDIDDLERIVKKNLERRYSHIEHVNHLIELKAKDFMEWFSNGAKN